MSPPKPVFGPGLISPPASCAWYLRSLPAENARFALPEPKVGLAALAGGMHRLPRTIGLKRAMGMMLTGRRVSAEEGERFGFVNEVVEPAALLPRALAAADAIAANAPLAVRETRRGMRELLHLSLADAWVRQEEIGAPLRRSEDAAEGARSFAEKRPPRWQGR